MSTRPRKRPSRRVPPDAAHAELRRRADMLMTAMELEGMAAWSWDRREDCVRVEYRAAATDLIRSDAPTLPAFLTRVHPADRERVRATIDTALAVPGIHRLEFRFRGAGGSERWIATAIQRFLRPGGEPGGLIGASRDITIRKETFRALADKEQRLRALSQEIIEAASREQERIGRDLHDGLGQELTGIALMLKALQGRRDATPRALQRELGEILRLVNHALGSTRTIASGLSPVAVERGGLAEALRALVDQVREGSRLRFRLSLRLPRASEPPPAVSLHLYRITQEALSNAMRHARATRISVSLHAGDGSLRLRIADDGAGIGRRRDVQGGLGLRIMQYRAQLIGALLEVKQPRAGGTAVVLTWRPAGGQEGRS